MTRATLRIATRGSALALAQAQLVRTHLEITLPETRVDILSMSTTGDRKTDWKLQEHGGKGLFTKEIEDALLNGSADLAVHSAKDLPTELPDKLTLAGFLPRADPRDMLVHRADCPTPRTIASGSPRRRTQGANLWPDAKWIEIRGNVETRLRKIAEGQADATLLAAAGLARLGISEHPGLRFSPLPVESMIPAAGQAAIAVECRSADLPLFEKHFDAPTATAVRIERTALAAMGGGCHSASAAYYDGRILHLLLPNGKKAQIRFEPFSLETTLEKLPEWIKRELSRDI